MSIFDPEKLVTYLFSLTLVESKLEAVWLQKNLRLPGYFHGREALLYSPKTVQAMMELQRNNSIKDDGVFNIDSKLLLYNLLQIYPTLKLVLH